MTTPRLRASEERRERPGDLLLLLRAEVEATKGGEGVDDSEDRSVSDCVRAKERESAFDRRPELEACDSRSVCLGPESENQLAVGEPSSATLIMVVVVVE